MHLKALTWNASGSLILSVTLAVALATGTQEKDKPKISARVNIVTLFATVHDTDGRVVKNLTRDDFVVSEDGVSQTISYFEQESDLPLTLGLLVDTSRSQIGVIDKERSASYTFLDQMLREGKDQAFVVSFDIHVDTLQSPTSTRSYLEGGLGQLRIPERHGTLVFSAIKNASKEWMYPRMGRKAFILLSDGVAFKDRTSLTEAIEFAQLADTIIYPIRYSDSAPFSTPGIGLILAVASQRGKQGLHRMAQETGGAYFEVTENLSIEQIYAQIEEALRNQYSIGYTPGRTTSDGKYHKIKLTAKNPHLIVSTRAGYYAK